MEGLTRLNKGNFLILPSFKALPLHRAVTTLAMSVPLSSITGSCILIQWISPVPGEVVTVYKDIATHKIGCWLRRCVEILPCVPLFLKEDLATLVQILFTTPLAHCSWSRIGAAPHSVNTVNITCMSGNSILGHLYKHRYCKAWMRKQRQQITISATSSTYWPHPQGDK